MWLWTEAELEAGPIVQTIFVAIFAGNGSSSLGIFHPSSDGLLISLVELRRGITPGVFAGLVLA